MELHFVELPKYVDRQSGLRSRLDKWLHVLRFGELYAAGNELPEDFQDEKELLMAMEEMKRVNADERLRAILEDREKEEHIRVTAINDARLQGREEGLKEGRDEGLKEGIEKGIEKGRKEGREEGLKEGIEKGRKEVRGE